MKKKEMSVAQTYARARRFRARDPYRYISYDRVADDICAIKGFLSLPGDARASVIAKLTEIYKIELGKDVKILY